MVRRALIGLTALVSVASAQPVPNATWTLSSPRTSPTVEWSANGRYVVLSSDSSVDLIDGNTNKVLWSRTATGALPSFLSYYAHPDRVHFMSDSKSVWIRTGTDTYTQVDVATGSVIRTHTFSDWTEDYVLFPTTNGPLVAVNLSVAAGVETLNVRSYDATTFALVKTRTASHAYIAGVDHPVGRLGTKYYVSFYDSLINAKTVETVTTNSGGTEAWAVGFDPDYGMTQAIVTGGSIVGTRHLNSAGTVDWSNNSLVLAPNATFAKTSASTLGFSYTGSALNVFDYASGSALYSSNLGLGGFGFSEKAVNPKDGRLVVSYGSAGSAATGLYLANATSADYQGSFVPVSGFAGIEPLGTGVLTSGSANFYGLVGSMGETVWSASGNTSAVGLASSASATLAAEVFPDHIAVVNAADGSPYATYAGSYTKALWVGDSQLIAVKSDASADRLDVSAGSITFRETLPVMFQAGGAVSKDLHYVVGYANSQILVYNLDKGGVTRTTYAQYSGWGSFFKIVFTASRRVALLEKTSSGYQWGLYNVVSGKLVADGMVPYNTAWTGTAFCSDIQPNKDEGSVSAFFNANGVGIDGTPVSELKIVRSSDGKVIASYPNVFTAVSGMKFSADGSALYVATGGTADSGPQNLVCLPVATWIQSVSVKVTPAESGGTSTVVIALAGAAPSTKSIVDLSISPNDASIPAKKYISAGLRAGSVQVTFPAVGTDTDYTISANIDGDPETVSTVVTLRAPVPSSITTGDTLVAGKSTTATINFTGVVPAEGTKVTLTCDNPLLTVTSGFKASAGETSHVINILSTSSLSDSTATITATVGSVTVSKTITVLATPVNSVVISPSTFDAGNSATGTITIGGKAGPGGLDVLLSSSLGSTQVPSSVHVPEGDIHGTFAVTSTTSDTASAPKITAKLGNSTKSTTLTVNQTPISSLTFSPSSLPAGNSTTGTVTIGALASTGGVTVGLTYTGAGVAGPASVVVPEGSNSATFTMTTTAALTGQTASATATYGASTKTTNLTINPTTVTAFTLTNGSVTGGSNCTGSITINAPAPAGGLVVNLTNNKSALINVPATITIAAGQTTFNFSWTTTPTLSSQTAAMTAKIANVGPTANQTVVAPKVISIAFSPDTVTGGTGSTFTVTLDGPSPAGYSITLSNGNTGRMTITSINPMKPTTGSTTVSGTVSTTAGAAATANLTATGVGGGTATATLTINP